MSPTSSLPATSIPRADASASIAATISCERRGLPVGHVHAHLGEPRARKREAERAHAGEAAAALTHERARSRAPAPRSSLRRFTLNAMSGGRTPTSTAPAVGCSSAGPRSGAIPSRPPWRKNARLAPVLGEPPVEVDGDAERRDAVGHGRARPRARAARPPGAGRRAERRRRRRRADARPRARAGRSGRSPPPPRPRACRRAPPRRRRACNTERLWSASVWTSRSRAGAENACRSAPDLRRVASLGDVRDRFEHHTPRESREPRARRGSAITTSRADAPDADRVDHGDLEVEQVRREHRAGEREPGADRGRGLAGAKRGGEDRQVGEQAEVRDRDPDDLRVLGRLHLLAAARSCRPVPLPPSGRSSGSRRCPHRRARRPRSPARRRVSVTS